MREIEIKISQIDSRMLVEVDGDQLPEIFSGYQITSSNLGESELALIVRGNIKSLFKMAVADA